MDQNLIYQVRGKISRKGKTSRIFGIIIIVLFAMAIAGSLIEGEDGKRDIGTAISYVPFLAAGVLLLLSGISKKKLLQAHTEYSGRLLNDPDHSLDGLAAKLGEPGSKVRKKLEKMIKLGLFPGCFVDASANRLVLPSSFAAAPNYAPTTAPVRYLTVACPGCGAKNTVPEGGVAECEFCGAKLSG